MGDLRNLLSGLARQGIRWRDRRSADRCSLSFERREFHRSIVSAAGAHPIKKRPEDERSPSITN